MQFERALAAFFTHQACGLGDGRELFEFLFGHENIILQSYAVCQVLPALFRHICEILSNQQRSHAAKPDAILGVPRAGPAHGVGVANCSG